MKNLLIFLLLISFAFGDNLNARLDKLMKNKSVKTITILKYDPFFTKQEITQTYKKEAVAKKKINIVKRKLRLVSILDGKAFVNNRWIRKNDIINGYKVKKVLKNSIILVKKKKKMILGFKKTKEILKVREK